MSCWADNEPAHLREPAAPLHACLQLNRNRYTAHTLDLRASHSDGRAGSSSTLDRWVDSSARLGRPSSGPALSGAPCAASAEPREAWRASIAQVFYAGSALPPRLSRCCRSVPRAC